jgi:hypothetical protein
LVIASGIQKGLDTMPREPETPATVRAAAEARGRLAFEQAIAPAEPEPTTPEPLSWLWESQPKEGKKHDEFEVLAARNSAARTCAD